MAKHLGDSLIIALLVYNTQLKNKHVEYFYSIKCFKMCVKTFFTLSLIIEYKQKLTVLFRNVKGTEFV